ncbi:MAG: PIN domain-containing protein [Lachnospiraceae bacterium]|nr:PIN domain-containing protein [Lachnospiraceae bacterium]
MKILVDTNVILDALMGRVPYCDNADRVIKLCADKEAAGVLAALQNKVFSDFEDCLQAECALSCEAEYIVTRNIKDFENSNIKAVTPDEFLTECQRRRGQ